MIRNPTPEQAFNIITEYWSNLCSDGEISEEKYEQIMDEVELFSPDILVDYYNSLFFNE